MRRDAPAAESAMRQHIISVFDQLANEALEVAHAELGG